MKTITIAVPYEYTWLARTEGAMARTTIFIMLIRLEAGRVLKDRSNSRELGKP